MEKAVTVLVVLAGWVILQLLLTQLFGDRLLVANPTGCSSIYGGNLPTTPSAINKDGRGPAWANSLFEDNAEFGLGYRLSLDKHREQAGELLKALEPQLGAALVTKLLGGAAGHAGQRGRTTAARRGPRCRARADGRSARFNPIACLGSRAGRGS